MKKLVLFFQVQYYAFASWVAQKTTAFTKYVYECDGGIHYLVEFTLGDVTFAWSGKSFEELYKEVPQPYRKYLQEPLDERVAKLANYIVEDDMYAAYERLIEADQHVTAWDIVCPWEPLEDEPWTVQDLFGTI